MSVRGVDAQQARALLEQGHRFLDVRTVEEFELGHVPGAFNVPVQNAEGDVLLGNPQFLPVARAAFDCDTPLIVGCHAAARAERACAELEAAGYRNLSRLMQGWDGRRDAFGRLTPGWSRLGLPMEQGDGGERSYRSLLTSLSTH
jgi:rhodanese-related sulfurtransferase